MNRKLAAVFVSCLSTFLPGALPAASAQDLGPEILISAHDQELAIVKDGRVLEKFRVSTSKYGLGDDFGSYRTPIGTLWVCNKIGDNLPLGAVIRHRSATGEVLRPNAPGRDPIVTRVLWLKGLNGETQNAYARCIYIHGTAEERLIGKAASFGCIRMRSKDVVKIFDTAQIGTHVVISEQPLKVLIAAERSTPPQQQQQIAFSN
jgi:hypothetical protein